MEGGDGGRGWREVMEGGARRNRRHVTLPYKLLHNGGQFFYR